MAEGLEGAVEVADGDVGMGDAVEHVGLDGGVVNHILKDDLVADGQWVSEVPGGKEVAAQATVAAKTVDEWGIEH